MPSSRPPRMLTRVRTTLLTRLLRVPAPRPEVVVTVLLMLEASSVEKPATPVSLLTSERRAWRRPPVWRTRRIC
jgi:hypothetical protein